MSSTAVDTDVAQLRKSSSDVDVTDPVNTPASDSDQRPNEGAPLLPDHITEKHTAVPTFTNEAHASPPFPSTRPLKAECPPEFSHPAAVEEQRIIWLPKDPLDRVQDVEKDLLDELDSYDIRFSSDGAEMDSQGHITVTSASPEEVLRTPITRLCECEKDKKGRQEGILSLWDVMRVVVEYASRLTR